MRIVLVEMKFFWVPMGLQIGTAGASFWILEIEGNLMTAHDLSSLARGGNPNSNCL